MADDFNKMDAKIFDDAMQGLNEVMQKQGQTEMAKTVESIIASNDNSNRNQEKQHDHVEKAQEEQLSEPTERVQEKHVAESSVELKSVLHKEKEFEMKKTVDSMEKDQQKDLIERVRDLIKALANARDSNERMQIAAVVNTLAFNLPDDVKREISNAEQKAIANEQAAGIKQNSDNMNNADAAKQEEERKQKEFDKNYKNLISNFDKGPLDSKGFEAASAFMKNADNRKRVESQAQSALDISGNLSKKEKEQGGLSPEDQKVKEAAQKEVQDNAKLISMPIFEQYGKEHGLDKEKTLELINAAHKAFGDHNFEGIKTVDELKQHLANIAEDTHANIKEREQAEAVIKAINEGEKNHESQEQLREDALEAFKHINEDNIKEIEKPKEQKTEVNNTQEAKAEVKKENNLLSDKNLVKREAVNEDKNSNQKQESNPKKLNRLQALQEAKEKAEAQDASTKTLKVNNPTNNPGFKGISGLSEVTKTLSNQGIGKLEDANHENKSSSNSPSAKPDPKGKNIT